MLALAFSFLVFVYWTVLGRAVVSLAYPRLGALRAWLVAPALGVSVLLLGLMVFNQAGIPIRTFATPLTIVLGVAAVGVIAWRRPVTPWRTLAPFLLAALVSCLWTGWPALQTGFNWISYANDDMANYCLAAQRFMDHGFYSVPTHADLAGRDYAAYYFFMHVADMMRFGSEHLVAWTASISHLQATQAFMPAILALSLVQIAGAAALVLHFGRWRRRALLTAWLLAASPLFMLGTLYELIAQVGGVALLLVTVALLLRPWGTPRRPTLIRYAILPSIAGAALCIFYPEVTPFAVLTFGAYLVLWTIRHRRFPAVLLTIATYTLAGVVILLRYNVISYVSILIVQAVGALDPTNRLLSLFPYFMLPTGFSDLFGWMPIAHDFREPIVSLTIATGMVLLAWILLRSLRQAWRLGPAAILLLLQFGLAARLFAAANDFGLYKLAMWIQPVLAAGLAGLLLAVTRRRTRLALAVAGVFALTTAPTAFYYTDSSRGIKSGGLTELRFASEYGLRPKPLPANHNAQLTCTIENVVAAKFAASELRGYRLAMISRDYFFPTTRWDYAHPTWPLLLQPHFDQMAQALPLIQWRNRTLIRRGRLWDTAFTHAIVLHPTDYYVSLVPRLSLFNKFNPPTVPVRHSVFIIEPAAKVHNLLVFVHSYLGNHYYLGDRSRISFFQQEPDLFAPGHDFNAIGRFMLLRIEKPSRQVYLRIADTRTLVTGRTAWSPRAVVHAEQDRPLGAVGNGAFNLFVGPLTPQPFLDAHYLAIDYAEIPHHLVDYRTGLKRLYNRKVPLDYRLVLGWARDISAISVAEYRHLQRPRSVAKFPQDLALAHNLEFSGAYEDGWLSPHAFFVLGAPRPGELVHLRGVVPALPGTRLGHGVIHVRINGQPVCDLAATAGRFDWLLPIPHPGPMTKIDLQFSVWAPLPGRDQRPAGAKLEYLGFASGVPSISCDYNQPDAPRLAAAGVDQDGWMNSSAALVVPPSDRPMVLSLQVENPRAPGGRDGTLSAWIDQSDLRRQLPLAAGTTGTLEIPLPPSAAPRTLHLQGPPDYALPAPDTRRRSVRIVRLQLHPATSS